MNYSTMSDAEIDAAVAERLRLKCVRGVWISSGNHPIACDEPRFVSDIAAAWGLVEDMPFVQLDNGWREVNGERVGGWTCRVVDFGKSGEVTASTAPRAICEAWLAAAEKQT